MPSGVHVTSEVNDMICRLLVREPSKRLGASRI